MVRTNRQKWAKKGGQGPKWREYVASTQKSLVSCYLGYESQAQKLETTGLRFARESGAGKIDSQNWAKKGGQGPVWGKKSRIDPKKLS